MTSRPPPRVCVIGAPIGHSRSPVLHSYWLRRFGVRGHYVPMEVAPEKLAEVIRLLPAMGFVGANITIPYKEDILEIADLVSDRATVIGAANTLIFRSDGKIHADNTDGYGFMANIRQTAPDWDPRMGPAVVFGAGGASRAVISALLDADVPEIRLANRTRIRADKLHDDFGNRVQVHEWVQAGNALEGATTVVNTTSLGMTGHPDLRVPLDALAPGMLVTDIVYTPLETRLLRVAREQGCTVVDGLGMLLHQAVPGFERWFGFRPVVDDDTRRAVLR